MPLKDFYDIKKMLRLDRLPHIWCPGCGNGIVTQAFLRAVHKRKMDTDKLVVVSGIGCSSRVVEFLDFDTVHTAHGRAIPFATGMKIANPDLNVVILAGDGDIAAIGGNHFIHGARRNIDLTVIIFNNFNYGMTGGQYSPLTVYGERAATAPYGMVETPFDMCELAKGAGATFVARSTTWHASDLTGLIDRALQHRGFSVVEVVTGCHVNYGKLNGRETPVKMLRWQRDHGVPVDKYHQLSEEDKVGMFPIGVLYHFTRPEYTHEYGKITGR